MKEEIDLLLVLIDKWWKQYRRGSNPLWMDQQDFTTELDEVLKEHFSELDIIYNPVLDRWVIKGIDER